MVHAVGSLALLLGMFLQDKDKKDNPEYAWWSGHKVGSWVKFKADIKSAEGDVELTQTSKLMEVTAEKAVLENVSKMKAGGQELPAGEKEKEEVKAKGEADFKIEKEGAEEEVEVGGKKLKCKTIEVSGDMGPMKIKGKMWVSKDVPGGLVKGDLKSEDGKMTMKMTVLEWEKK